METNKIYMRKVGDSFSFEVFDGGFRDGIGKGELLPFNMFFFNPHFDRAIFLVDSVDTAQKLYDKLDTSFIYPTAIETEFSELFDFDCFSQSTLMVIEDLVSVIMNKTKIDHIVSRKTFQDIQRLCESDAITPSFATRWAVTAILKESEKRMKKE